MKFQGNPEAVYGNFSWMRVSSFEQIFKRTQNWSITSKRLKITAVIIEANRKLTLLYKLPSILNNYNFGKNARMLINIQAHINNQ